MERIRMEIFSKVQDFFKLLEGTLLTISGSVAVIGVIGLGIMYAGSSLPLISDWKQNNPKAFSQVTWGLIFLVFAGSGGVAGLLGK